MLTRADPASVGITSIGGLLHPIDVAADEGLWLEFSEEGQVISAPIAPGLYEDVGVSTCQAMPLGHIVECIGPGTLAFDGERERTLKVGQTAQLTMSRTGPLVVDVNTTLHRAAEIGSFKR